MRRIRSRLAQLADELERARQAEHVLADQVEHLTEVADDAETRKLTAETPLAERAWREARTDLDRHAGSLEDTRRLIADLRAEQDALLDQLVEQTARAGGGTQRDR